MASSKSSSASSSPARTPSTSSVVSGDSNAASEKKKPSILNGITDSQCFVTVVIGEGEEAKQFTLYKDVLCSGSIFFDSVINGKEKFNEGDTHLLYLKDVEPSVFGLFSFWLYSGGTIRHRKVGEKKDDTLNQTPTQLAKLWVLASRFRMPKLQNAIIHEIFCAIEIMFRDMERLQLIGETHAQLMTPFIEYAYETNLTMLRDLAVDRLAFGCSESVFMDIVELLPSHIVVDVAKVLRAGIRMCAEDFYLAED